MRKLLIALFAACLSTAFVVGSVLAEDKKETVKKDDDKQKAKKDTFKK